MATFLHRLGRFAAHRPWRVIAVWLVLLGVVAGSAAAFSKPFGTQFSMPDSEYERVLEELQQSLPDAAGGTSTIVLTTEDGSFSAEQRQAIADAIERWEGEDGVASVTDPFTVQQQLDDAQKQIQQGRQQLEQGEQQLADARTQLQQAEQALAQPGLPDAQRAAIQAQVEQGRQQLKTGRQQLDTQKARLETGAGLAQLSDGIRFVSDDGSAAIAQITFDDPMPEVSPEVREAVVADGGSLADAGVEVSYSQEITQETSVGGIGEVVGLAVAVVVLLVVLGSLVLAGLPLLTALFGVGAGVGGAVALTAFVELNSVTPTLAVMLGLAVGIDYALFVINRHRQGLAAGLEVKESIALAVGTAGNAVVVAGATVVIALMALLVSGIPLLREMGVVAAATVAITVVTAITLTPALVSLVGERARPKAKKAGEAPQAARGSARWVETVTRRPWLAIVGVVVALGVVAIPTASLRLGLPDGGSEPADSSAYRAYTTIEREFGAGVNGPIVAVARFDQPVAKDGVEAEQLAVGRQIADTDGVSQVAPIGVSEDRTLLAFQVVPDEGPSSESTVELAGALRDLGDRLDADGIDLGITGQTVANIEISERLADALPIYLILVVGLSLVLLTAVFRSIVVPLLATAGFLLSVGASFGAVVAVYQWGWLGGLFDVSRPGAILSFMPILLIGVLFGLAMDYQMFLVSGMHEAHAHGEDARRAVHTGFRNGARIVTAAAIIMISVFGGFVFSHMAMVRPIGFGLAIGVLIDAFLIRMTLVPAAMHLLGERAWYLPRWLDKVLPDLDIEGSRLAARRSAEPAEEPESVGAR